MIPCRKPAWTLVLRVTIWKYSGFFKVQKTAREEKTVTAGLLTLPVHSLSTNLSTGIVDNKKTCTSWSYVCPTSLTTAMGNLFPGTIMGNQSNRAMPKMLIGFLFNLPSSGVLSFSTKFDVLVFSIQILGGEKREKIWPSGRVCRFFCFAR